MFDINAHYYIVQICRSPVIISSHTSAFDVAFDDYVVYVRTGERIA